MLARLQQVTTIGLLLLAAALVAAGWWLAALLIVFGYAIFLGVEFVLLYFVHREDDPTLRATPGQLLSAWAGEVASAPRVFCWQQPFRSNVWPDHLPAESQGRRGLLLVHGFVCNRGVWNPWLARLTAAGVPFVAVNMEPVFGSIDDYAADIDTAIRRLEDVTGLPPVAVAHSMGGLALRRWWSEHRLERLHHAVTIGTPHRGTWLARFAMSHNARQMRQLGGWLDELVQRETSIGPERAARYTCYYSHCDNIVFPPATATLPGADNRHLTGVAHVHMVTRPEPYAAVLALLLGS